MGFTYTPKTSLACAVGAAPCTDTVMFWASCAASEYAVVAAAAEGTALDIAKPAGATIATEKPTTARPARIADEVRRRGTREGRGQNGKPESF